MLALTIFLAVISVGGLVGFTAYLCSQKSKANDLLSLIKQVEAKDQELKRETEAQREYLEKNGELAREKDELIRKKDALKDEISALSAQQAALAEQLNNKEAKFQEELEEKLKAHQIEFDKTIAALNEEYDKEKKEFEQLCLDHINAEKVFHEANKIRENPEEGNKIDGLTNEVIYDIGLLRDTRTKSFDKERFGKFIWDYYQKRMNEVVEKGLAANPTDFNIGFIYRVYNTNNGKSYIGQAKSAENLKVRWVAHAKGILGADNAGWYPQGYKDGRLEDYTFSVLEPCEGSRLNEREDFYIDQFDSINNGYNSRYNNRRKA